MNDINNNQCIAEPFYCPADGMTVDQQPQIIVNAQPIDKGNDPSPSITYPIEERGGGRGKDWGGFLLGCSSYEAADRPSFDNPEIELITKGYNETGANQGSWSPFINYDGRFTVFTSRADNLVKGDENGHLGIFVHDRETGKTEHIDKAYDGSEANGDSEHPSISDDGRFVAYSSFASNLVKGDNNGNVDIFLYDRDEKKTSLISKGADGEANANSHLARISADGRYITFNSDATNIVPYGVKGKTDVFVYDRQTKNISRVNLTDEGFEVNGGCGAPSISGDGAFIAFGSQATDLVPGDNNGLSDVFLRDMAGGAVYMLSTTGKGNVSNGNSGWPIVSAGGKAAVFQSTANNLAQDNFDAKHEDEWKVFVVDTESKKFKKCSGYVLHSGYMASAGIYGPLFSISADGMFVSLATYLSLKDGDNDELFDIYVCNTENGDLARVTTKKVEESSSKNPSISGDGESIAFEEMTTGYPYPIDIFVAKNPLFEK